MKKDLISIADLTTKEINEIIDVAAKLKEKPFAKKGLFWDKTLALLFQKPSNRTRISLEVAMTHLGGHTMYLSPREIEMGAREPVKDVARVISRYVDVIVARVFYHQDVVDLAKYSDVPVINGLSDLAHPCQALADLMTIKEKFKNLKKAVVSYIGDGNNVLNSLMVVCAKTGVRIKIGTPKGYEPDAEMLKIAMSVAKKNKSSVELYNDPKEAAKGADVVYTDVWVSMGQEDEREKRLKDFRAYQVNDELLSKANKNAIIMHCLPAHRGEEISDCIDGKNSVVFDQAENRMHVAKAVLLRALS